MSELVSMLETLVAEVAAGRPAAFCAIVATRGSAPQVPGATMLVCADFSTRGTLGGGCVEAEVRRRAFELLQRGQSQVLDFNLNADYGWDDGLICGGQMTIAVQILNTTIQLTPYSAALHAARRRQPMTLPLVVAVGEKRLEYQLRLEAPPTLLIAGAGHVGQAVARLAVGLDFHVVVIDDRAEYAAAHRFPPGVQAVIGDIAHALRDYPLDDGCHVVIVTRGHQHDRAALDAVVRRPAAYIGMIGSRRKSRLVLDELAAAGVPAADIARVHTPIGVPIGAVTVPEIAVSIVAELVQIRRRRTPAPIDGPRDVTPCS